ncbi:hypothetical protein [uncultured Dokdonia sp.]|uniref:hypothetical protein n=1 Tax=uncultured Dokdonia sp. TaxID=575653 RepID=UPI0026127FF4|nr:hypothetical protein [uncultured Dokdonia sp.]
MTDKSSAILITESFLKGNDTYQDYIIDFDKILERDTLWYIPFKESIPNPSDLLVGAYNGIIVDKNSTDYFQPGSALDLEKWMYGFKIGLRGGRYDLVIEKINDYRSTLEMLDKLRLTYVKIELENGTEWKIPKDFKRKEIKKRLDKMPCTFKNQAFTFLIDEFRQIRNERMFEYRLLRTEDRKH